jgi:hypothetical protein
MTLNQLLVELDGFNELHGVSPSSSLPLLSPLPPLFLSLLSAPSLLLVLLVLLSSSSSRLSLSLLSPLSLLQPNLDAYLPPR